MSDFRKPNPNRGKYSPTTKMIGKVSNIEVSKHHYPVTEDDEFEAVALSFRLASMRKATFWSLTQLTEEELLAVRYIFESAFDTALPICIQKDKEARDAYERGDDSDPRVYRAAPVLVDRERGKRTHSPLLRERPAPVSSVVQGDSNLDGQHRGEGTGVAQHPSTEVGGQDHPA